MALCADCGKYEVRKPRAKRCHGCQWELRKAKFAEYQVEMQQRHEAHKANAALNRDFDQAMSR